MSSPLTQKTIVVLGISLAMLLVAGTILAYTELTQSTDSADFSESADFEIGNSMADETLRVQQLAPFEDSNANANGTLARSDESQSSSNKQLTINSGNQKPIVQSDISNASEWDSVAQVSVAIEKQRAEYRYQAETIRELINSQLKENGESELMDLPPVCLSSQFMIDSDRLERDIAQQTSHTEPIRGTRQSQDQQQRQHQRLLSGESSPQFPQNQRANVAQTQFVQPNGNNVQNNNMQNVVLQQQSASPLPFSSGMQSAPMLPTSNFGSQQGHGFQQMSQPHSEFAPGFAPQSEFVHQGNPQTGYPAQPSQYSIELPQFSNGMNGRQPLPQVDPAMIQNYNPHASSSAHMQVLNPEIDLNQFIDKDPHAEVFECDQFPSAIECRKCHEQIFEEWSSSSHAYAGISPMFHKFEQKINDLAQGTIGYFCMRCHAPVATTLNVPRDNVPWNGPRVFREGVTCIACHRVKEKYAKANGERRIEPGTIHDPVYGTSDGMGIEEVVKYKDKYKVKTDPEDEGIGQPIHRRSIQFEQLSESSFCASCHQVAVQPQIKLEVVWDQYRGSPACREGITCQDCHMGKVPGVADGYSIGPAALVNDLAVNPRAQAFESLFLWTRIFDCSSWNISDESRCGQMVV